MPSQHHTSQYASKSSTKARIDELVSGPRTQTPLGLIKLPADTTHCPPILRRVKPWDLVCAFFSYSGACSTMLSEEDYMEIGGTASGYVETMDWSFIRDCDVEEREAMYLKLCLHIRNSRIASDVYQAIRAQAKDKAAA